MHHSQINSDVRKLIADGTVLPAHPLALTAERQLDKQHQRALTRYYIDAGSAALPSACTRPSSRSATSASIVPCSSSPPRPRPTGPSDRWRWLQASPVRPGRRRPRPAPRATSAIMRGLLSLAAMKSASEDEIIAHCTAVAAEIPLVGFYLQPAVGGVILSSRFWQRFASIDHVIAIKIAPFNRYRTLDVLRGVAAAGALDRVALYTGNDDHILLDLMLPFDLRDNGVTTRTYFKGGLLGHWSVWTAERHQAVRTLQGGAAQG